MKQLNTLEYLRLNKIQRLIYKIQEFFCAIPGRTVSFFKKLGTKILDFFKFLIDDVVDIGVTFKKGSWMTRVSYLIMNPIFGNLNRIYYP